MFEVVVFDPQMLNGTVLSTISGLVSPHIVIESCNFLSSSVIVYIHISVIPNLPDHLYEFQCLKLYLTPKC